LDEYIEKDMNLNEKMEEKRRLEKELLGLLEEELHLNEEIEDYENASASWRAQALSTKKE
jgi:hypothetical protein